MILTWWFSSLHISQSPEIFEDNIQEGGLAIIVHNYDLNSLAYSLSPIQRARVRLPFVSVSCMRFCRRIPRNKCSRYHLVIIMTQNHSSSISEQRWFLFSVAVIIAKTKIYWNFTFRFTLRLCLFPESKHCRRIYEANFSLCRYKLNNYEGLQNNCIRHSRICVN